MANRREYLDYLSEWLSPLGEITMKGMFGGHAVYCGGLIFALVADNVLYLKVDDVSRPRFEALSLSPFQPFPDKPGTMSYYPVPPEFFEDPSATREWAREAIAATKRAAPKKKRRV